MEAMRTIVAALAIYGEDANFEALIEKARALNENQVKADSGHKVEVYRDEGGFYRWRRRAENGQIVSDSAEGYTDKRWAEHQATGLNEGVEVVDLTEKVGEATGEKREGIEVPAGTEGELVVEQSHPLPEQSDG